LEDLSTAEGLCPSLGNHIWELLGKQATSKQQVRGGKWSDRSNAGALKRTKPRSEFAYDGISCAALELGMTSSLGIVGEAGACVRFTIDLCLTDRCLSRNKSFVALKAVSKCLFTDTREPEMIVHGYGLPGISFADFSGCMHERLYKQRTPGTVRYCEMA
jgi:hypothetical protein